MTEVTETKLSKGERTKRQIVEAALDLFRERGYEATTMRDVAARANVSVGNAYYYFSSKEHLVQAFYDRTHEDHLAAFLPILERETSFKELMRQLLYTKIETAEPYHHFSSVLFKTAADPKSPLNPFSEQSSELRGEATELIARMIERSDQKVPDDIADSLPELLWLYEMSVILYWLHDPTKGRVRTKKLIDRSVDIVTKLLGLSRLPMMGPIRRNIPELLGELRAVSAEAVAVDADAESESHCESRDDDSDDSEVR